MEKYIVLCACVVVGFFAGRWTVVEKEIVKYVKGETIRDTITNLLPDTVYLAGELKYKYVYKRDTIYEDVPVIDRDATIKETIQDWNLTRVYKKNLFDNNSGKLDVDVSVQYNELQKLSYAFTPVEKHITGVRKKVFIPFLSASYSTLNFVGIGGGFFYHDIGIRIEYTTDLEKKELCVGVMYKF